MTPSGTGVATDGTEMRLRSDVPHGAQLRARGLEPVSATWWRREAKALLRQRERRRSRLPGAFDVATRGALRVWDTSARKVVRVPAVDGVGPETVGLLLGAA